MSIFFQVLKDIVGWFFGTIFWFLALGLFLDGAVIGGIAALLFGIGVTPLRRKIFSALNVYASGKATFIALTCLFLVFCGSLGMVSSSAEAEPERQVQEKVEVAEQTTAEIALAKVGNSSEETVAEDKFIAEDVLREESITEEAVKEETITEEAETEDSHLEEPEERVFEMQVHYIDVGQGDATLIISGDHTMLIDAGDDSKGTKVQHYLQNQGVEKLDYLVLTHTDADHIGGADVIVSKFDVANVFMGDFPKDNNVYRDLMQALSDKGLKYLTPPVGENYALGDAFFTILAPNREYSDPNNTSIALLIQNGENRFLFTGDAEEEAESDIVLNGLNLDCDVFKAGHHGSKTSNSVSILNAASPDVAVISCEEDNSYGHPHAEVLNNLRAMGVKVFRTDEQGSVVAVSDGKEITWNCVPSESWKAGESTQNSLDDENSSESLEGDNYAVNSKNGKIHIVGACSATETGDSAMTSPVYFATYEEAEAYSMQIEPEQDKRKCGNCYK